MLNFDCQSFTAKEATDMLTPAMNLAAGTGTNLSETPSGLGNAMKTFGADSSEATNYADVLAKAQVNHNHFLEYTKVSDGKLIIDPEQAVIVKRICQEYLEGLFMKKIADGLEKDGMRISVGKDEIVRLDHQ